MKWDDRIGRRLRLHDLHVLLTVAELGSMGKAAERLAVSQPSVSKAIADMEHTIGVRLLDRTPKGVECTAYGRALLQRGMGAFDELRQGIKDIEVLTDPTAGEIRVGCPEAIAAGLLSGVIDRFSRRYPRVVIDVVAANNMSPEFRPLRDRAVDFLVGRLSQPLAPNDATFAAQDLEAEILFQERMLIVSGRKNRCARRRRIDLTELIDEPWILPPDTLFSSLIAEIFRTRGLSTPKASIRSYSTHQVVNLLATNRFVSALSGNVLRFNSDRFSLKVLPVDITVRSWPVGIVTLKNRTVSPVVQTFINCIREVAKPMVKAAGSAGA
jgi:DNA-binding transcriptional LysR family regulator